jgi:hypothetical protein
MFHEVKIHEAIDGRYRVQRLGNSVGWLNADDLVAELRENCDGLCEIGVDPLPSSAEDIRDKVMEKLERILCYEVPGKGVHYMGIKYVSASSLRLVSNREQ